MLCAGYGKGSSCVLTFISLWGCLGFPAHLGSSFCSMCPRYSQAPSLPPGPMTRVLALVQRCTFCIRPVEWEAVCQWCCPFTAITTCPNRLIQEMRRQVFSAVMGENQQKFYYIKTKVRSQILLSCFGFHLHMFPWYFLKGFSLLSLNSF